MSSDEMKIDMDSLSAMARRLGLKGKDSESYIHEHMTKLGYKSRRSYYKDEKSSTSGSSFTFFGGGGSNSSDDDED